MGFRSRIKGRLKTPLAMSRPSQLSSTRRPITPPTLSAYGGTNPMWGGEDTPVSPEKNFGNSETASDGQENPLQKMALWFNTMMDGWDVPTPKARRCSSSCGWRCLCALQVYRLCGCVSVDCFHEGPNILVIDPEKSLTVGPVSRCPVERFSSMKMSPQTSRPTLRSMPDWPRTTHDHRDQGCAS